jgi:hypothetical protein
MPNFIQKVGGLPCVAVALVLLSGCAAQVISSSPRTVVVRAGDARIAESQAMADAECAKHSRFARLIARPTPSSAEFIFDCVN